MALTVCDTIEQFAELMNARAAELGMTNTHFVTPSGLDADGHFTTARDMAILAQAVLEHPLLAEICALSRATVYIGNPKTARTLKNHNRLLTACEGAVGLKTGYTQKAGRCLVSAVRRGGVTLIAVTLRAPDDWNDHKLLLDYGLSQTEQICITNDDITDIIPVVSSDADHLRIKADPINLCVSVKSKSNIKRVVQMERFLYAPVKAGESVGKICYYLGDMLIGSSNIYSVADLQVRNKKEKFSVRFLKNLLQIWNNC